MPSQNNLEKHFSSILRSFPVSFSNAQTTQVVWPFLLAEFTRHPLSTAIEAICLEERSWVILVSTCPWTLCWRERPRSLTEVLVREGEAGLRATAGLTALRSPRGETGGPQCKASHARLTTTRLLPFLPCPWCGRPSWRTPGTLASTAMSPPRWIPGQAGDTLRIRVPDLSVPGLLALCLNRAAAGHLPSTNWGTLSSCRLCRPSWPAGTS